MGMLVFGQTGQVARELCAQRDVIALGREDVDLSDAKACASAIAKISPSSVINVAAYTAVDRAEEEEGLAMQINGVAPAAMARACAALDIPFVHLSTDYVFDGSGVDPIKPDREPAPLSAYGRSKLAGERGIEKAGGIHAIVRTSWVFSAHGSNFAKTMLRLGSENDELRIVSDQVGGPTSARSIAKACLAIVKQLSDDPSKSGTYHFSGAPDTSWAGFARGIFRQGRIDCDVKEIATSDYPVAAARPLNSRLDCSSTKTTFGIERPDWRAELRAVMGEIRKKGQQH